MPSSPLVNASGTAIDERRIEQLRTSCRGELLRPGDADYDPARQHLERQHRQASRPDRPLFGAGGRHRRRQFRARDGAARRDPRRRPQRRRPGALRRRAGDRPVADEGHSRRRRGPAGPRPARRHARRSRSRNARAWPGRAGRRGVEDRHRRSDARRRRRVAGAEVRPHRRQRHLLRDCHRRRPGADRERRPAPGSVLGPPRRRRQLRRRHLVRIPRASGEHGAWRPGASIRGRRRPIC